MNKGFKSFQTQYKMPKPILREYGINNGKPTKHINMCVAIMSYEAHGGKVISIVDITAIQEANKG